jgi:hypothetical protein
VIAEMLCKVFLRLELADVLMALEQMGLQCFPRDMAMSVG